MSSRRPPLAYAVLVTALAAPLWLAGDTPLLGPASPIRLPMSALVAATPLTAALLLSARQGGVAAMAALMRQAVAFGRRPLLVILALGLMPAVLGLEAAILHFAGRLPEHPRIALEAAPALAGLFLLGAVGEELGWQAYAYPRLAEGRRPMIAGLQLGLFWALWHVPPFLQTGHDAWWVAWQCVTTVLLRMVIVWLYVAGGGAVGLGVLFHTMINMAEFLFPNLGSHYDPFVASLIEAALVAFLFVGPGASACGRAGLVTGAERNSTRET